MDTPLNAWHAQEASAAMQALDSSEQGLNDTQVAERLARHGPNLLPQAAGDSLWLVAWRQFNNPISWVLIGAGVLAVALQKPTDALVVLLAVIINALIGFVQEWRASRAIAALAALVPQQATVVRAGVVRTVPSAELVPGDLVVLAAGDQVPADLRLIETKGLSTEEAALTGESVPVAKTVAAVAAEAGLGDRLCLAFSGTHVTRGTGRGLVVTTGAATQIGHINALLNHVERLETPLTRQLTTIGRWITIAVVAVALAMFVYGVWARGGKPGEAALSAITLAVAAIPEGLPAIITIALAIGVRRMAARKAVVRQLPAVETLGSTSAICSDKTGTLTRNEMTVVALWVEGHEYRLSGIGYVPDGALEHDGQRLGQTPEPVRSLLQGAILCNDAGLNQNAAGWSIAGDPTEAALVVAGRKAGLVETAERQAAPRLDAVPFESETRFMATLHRTGPGLVGWMKGAPEAVLPRTGLDEAGQTRVSAAQEAFAEQGLRVLAVARHLGATSLEAGSLASGWELVGLIGMIDPPRQEAMTAIRTCKEAGISVTMITGDHPATAAAIGRDLGLPHAVAMTGSQLDRLDAAGFRAAVRDCHIFARVSPEHKIKLVEALQAEGRVVAMTGDGVNDAPALKRADIGVAMGITGTAVSQQAAKIVLADDNFATIAAAVEEGRRVYDNLVKALAFILPTNLGLAAILAAATMLFPTIVVDGLGTELLLPMSPTQILWINLVASVALSLPIAFEMLEPGTMQRPPRLKSTPIFSRFVVWRTILVSLLMAAGTCLLFLWEFQRFVAGIPSPLPMAVYTQALAEAQTIAVTTVALIQVCYLLHCRSLIGSLSSMGLWTNPLLWPCILLLLLAQFAFIYIPGMQDLFHTRPLDFAAWWHALIPGLAVLAVIDLEKRWLRRAAAPA